MVYRIRKVKKKKEYNEIVCTNMMLPFFKSKFHMSNDIQSEFCIKKKSQNDVTLLITNHNYFMANSLMFHTYRCSTNEYRRDIKNHYYMF